ncbi:MAG: hypothetical protein MI923_24090 [Phycisphaerales bacterium]|nr:hypothetical protein [Phycisphaerales bacterium]
MSDSKEEAKQIKKTAKAESKSLKKMTQAQADPAPSNDPTETTGLTPAERSAAAAERQVRLQHFRVWLALAAVIVGVITILATIKPWSAATNEPTTKKVSPSTQPVSP